MLDFSPMRSTELVQFLQLFSAQSQQRINEVKSQRDQLDVKSGVYSDLKTRLKDLEDKLERFGETGDDSPFSAKETALSDERYLTATAGSSAAALAHTVRIDQLARSHSTLSNRYTSTDTSLSLAYAGTKNFSITVDGAQYDVSVSIGAGETNEQVLGSIASAINAVEDIEVRASSITDTDTTKKLSIASTETGSSGVMTFTDTDGLLAAIGITNASAATDSTGGYIYADLGGNELDSKLTVDGINIVRASNTLDDVIEGVTLELRAAHEIEDPDLTVTVSNDMEMVTTDVQELLDAYNEAQQYLSTKTSVDPTTYARGDLAGEYSYVNLWQNLRGSMTGLVSSMSAEEIYSLSQIGITSDSLGKLSISDSEKFEEKISGDLDLVEELFSASDGIAARMQGLIDDYTDASGIINNSEDTMQSRMDRLDTKIEQLEQRYQLEEERLVEEFGALQALQAEMSILQSMMGSMNSFFG